MSVTADLDLMSPTSKGLNKYDIYVMKFPWKLSSEIISCCMESLSTTSGACTWLHYTCLAAVVMHCASYRQITVPHLVDLWIIIKSNLKICSGLNKSAVIFTVFRRHQLQPDSTWRIWPSCFIYAGCLLRTSSERHLQQCGLWWNQADQLQSQIPQCKFLLYSDY